MVEKRGIKSDKVNKMNNELREDRKEIEREWMVG